jgi:hypothetical protein
MFPALEIVPDAKKKKKDNRRGCSPLQSIYRILFWEEECTFKINYGKITFTTNIQRKLCY